VPLCTPCVATAGMLCANGREPGCAHDQRQPWSDKAGRWGMEASSEPAERAHHGQRRPASCGSGGAPRVSSRPDQTVWTCAGDGTGCGIDARQDQSACVYARAGTRASARLGARWPTVGHVSRSMDRSVLTMPRGWRMSTAALVFAPAAAVCWRPRAEIGSAARRIWQRNQHERYVSEPSHGWGPRLGRGDRMSGSARVVHHTAATVPAAAPSVPQERHARRDPSEHSPNNSMPCVG